jgi:DNA-binding PadR family transcriptional regulator
LRNQRFGHGELHLALLALLARRPMHGYELMHELAGRMGTRYKPSPGSIYPAVSALSSEGLIDATEHAGRKVYGLTPLGSDALTARLDELARIETDLGVRFSEDSAEAALAHFTRRARDLARHVELETFEATLNQTITSLEGLAKEES